MKTIHKALWKASKKKQIPICSLLWHRCQTLPGSEMWILCAIFLCGSRIFMKLFEHSRSWRSASVCLALAGSVWGLCLPEGKRSRGGQGPSGNGRAGLMHITGQHKLPLLCYLHTQPRSAQEGGGQQSSSLQSLSPLLGSGESVSSAEPCPGA